MLAAFGSWFGGASTNVTQAAPAATVSRPAPPVVTIRRTEPTVASTPAKPRASPVHEAAPVRRPSVNVARSPVPAPKVPSIRRGPKHASPKWRPASPPSEVESDKAPGRCVRCAARATAACPECDSALCERCERTAVQTCWYCARTACHQCSPWYEAAVQSSAWKGEEREVPFCTEDCAHQSLVRCQRAANPVRRMVAVAE